MAAMKTNKFGIWRKSIYFGIHEVKFAIKKILWKIEADKAQIIFYRGLKGSGSGFSNLI